MSTLEELRHEHKHIVRMLKIIDHTSDHILTDRPVPINIVRDEITFVRGFADQCHHSKEELVVFPTVEQRLDAGNKEEMNSLINDHIESRKLIKDAEEALTEYEAGDAKAADRIAYDFKNYYNLLIDHIKRENVFFEEIWPLFGDAEIKDIDERCEQIEEELDSHERFLEMLDRLEASDILRKTA